MTAAESFIILKTKLTDDFDTDSVNDHDFLANLKPFGAQQTFSKTLRDIEEKQDTTMIFEYVSLKSERLLQCLDLNDSIILED